MKEIREVLGPDAMILSNRQTERGVEIVAIASNDFASLTVDSITQQPEIPAISADEWTRSVDQADPETVAIAQVVKPKTSPRQPLQFEPVEIVETAGSLLQAGLMHLSGALKLPGKLFQSAPEPQPSNVSITLPPKAPPEAPLAAPPEPPPELQPRARVAPNIPKAVAQPPAPDLSAQETILSEIKSMSAMLQQQFAALYWNNTQIRDPQSAGLLRKMLNAGFSTILSHQMLDNLPPGNTQGEAWIKQVLKRNLLVAGKADDIISKGGVYALIGPTGVGKTTTTAKMAARAVVRYGAARVALLTTDSYRIAAYEQLKIYGKILGVAVHAVKDADDLRLTLSALRHKHLVLIDTVGMGQRDERVMDQSEMFDATGVSCLLLLNTTNSGETLEDVVRMYRSSKVVGCIPTKLDEAVSLGSVLDVMVRHRLKIHYMTNGQRVPEDLHPVNVDYMLHRTFKSLEGKTPFTLHELDFPVSMGDIPAKKSSYAP